LPKNNQNITLNDKIGKVINEIKQLNQEKAQRFGLQRGWGDATFNERDELSRILGL
jgi:hypothetical protein